MPTKLKKDFQMIKENLETIIALSNKCPKGMRRDCFRILLKDALTSTHYDRLYATLSEAKNEPNTTHKRTITLKNKQKVSHGFIQFFTWVVFSLCLYVIVRFGSSYLKPYDAAFLISILLAFAIAVTFSNAYNADPSKYKDQFAQDADRQRSTWLHAHFCWQIVNIWLAVAPVYSTGIVVYISQDAGDINTIKDRIIIYSVFSLLCSFASFSLQPNKRAKGFKEAYNVVRLSLLFYSMSSPENRDKQYTAIYDAILKGEAAIYKADSE